MSVQTALLIWATMALTGEDWVPSLPLKQLEEKFEGVDMSVGNTSSAMYSSYNRGSKELSHWMRTIWDVCRANIRMSMSNGTKDRKAATLPSAMTAVNVKSL